VDTTTKGITMSGQGDSMPDREVPAWHVLGDQIRKEDTLAGGGLAEVYVIPYSIDSGPAKGHKGSVRVAVDDYTPDEVERAVVDEVATTHAIGTLGKARV
jgi:hypothetical protein